MKISEFLDPNLIEIGIKAKDKWELIEHMANLLAKSGKIGDVKKFHEKLLERERTMTTGLGHGMAIPHALCDCVEQIVIAAGTLAEPIDFESFDFEPIYVIFSIASPEDRDKRYMHYLSRIARLFSRPGFAQQLARAKSPQEFIEIIRQSEQ